MPPVQSLSDAGGNPPTDGVDWWTPLPPEQGALHAGYEAVDRRRIDQGGGQRGWAVHRHLRKLRDRARGVKSIGDAFEAIQAGETIDDDVLFDKLSAAGLVRGQARGEVAFRYKLYTEYFSKHPL